MNETAFDEFVGIVDEAIDIAECALKEAAAARQAAPAGESITLVKVASDRYRNAARELIRTGTFRDHNVESLSKALENAGSAEYLDIMEKLASRAVFPLDAGMELGGDLVEKSADNRAGDTSKTLSGTELWVQSCRYAGLEV